MRRGGGYTFGRIPAPHAQKGPQVVQKPCYLQARAAVRWVVRELPALALGLLAAVIFSARILGPNLHREGASAAVDLLWVGAPAVAVVFGAAWVCARAVFAALDRRGDVPGSWRSVRACGFFDRHPIFVPAAVFSLCWVPYVVVFFRRTIAFGDLGEPVACGTWAYVALLACQLVVCVISHSLTIRTIVRIRAPRWLIWGSIAFFSLSPIWGMLTAADIRHPLFAAAFCVFVSSTVFTLYAPQVKPAVWVELGLGALAVCLLRSDGIVFVAPTLVCIAGYKLYRCRVAQSADGRSLALGLRGSSELTGAVATLVGVLVAFALAARMGWGLPLGEPGFGTAWPGQEAVGVQDVALAALAQPRDASDIAGVLSYGEVKANSMDPALAARAARVIYRQQALPVFGLTYEAAAYVLVFMTFFLYAVGRRDGRALVVGVPMFAVLLVMLVVPQDATLRYLLPVMAAQPMLFGACMVRTGPDRSGVLQKAPAKLTSVD